MKKQKKQLIILAVLLVIMIAVLVSLRFLPKEDANEQSQSYQVTALDSEKVTEVSLTNESGTVSFKKNKDKWQNEQDTALEIDEDKISDLIGKVASYSSENIIENVEDASIYGIDNPTITIALKTDKDEVTVCIGDYNNTAGIYYLALKDDAKTVYTIKAGLIATYKQATVADFVAEETTETESTETETAQLQISETEPIQTQQEETQSQ